MTKDRCLRTSFLTEKYKTAVFFLFEKQKKTAFTRSEDGLLKQLTHVP